MTSGYDAAREQAQTVARGLREVALLIGEPATCTGSSSQPVTLGTGEELVPGLGLNEDAAALSIRAHDLEQGLFKVLVLGEFKNGKSTLLNAMLGSKTLPAKAAPSTAIITVLVYGEREEVEIHETGQREPRLVSWAEFISEFQLSRQDQETLEGRGAIDRFQQIEYAQIERPHPLCAHGVKLIDSPGLGEHLSRTRVSTNFLKQAQAVIFVLNATRILTQDERDFIETSLGTGRLPSVFFVINRINQVDETAIPEIQRWVERALAPHFQDETGVVDADFYQRRVFFLDARAALEARSSSTHDEDQLAHSGVLALERELEAFLTGEERVITSLQSALRQLTPVLVEAHRRIEREKTALNRPLEELEKQRAESEKRLDALERRRREIERTILLFGDTIRQKVYGSLRAFVDEMHETWPEDSHRLVDLDQVVTLKNVLTSYAQPEVRDRMAAGIAEQVQRYLQTKFGEWAEQIPATIQPDVDTMVAEIEAQVEDFQLELQAIAALFAGTPPSDDRSTVQGARLLRLALSLDDIGELTDDVTGINDWRRQMGRWVQQAVIVMIVGTFITGSFFIALLIVQAVQLGLHEGEVKRRMREKLGQRLHESLQEQVAERQGYIRDAVGGRFRQLATNLTDVIQSQIDEVRAEQDRILAQRRDERFSVEHEQRRLDMVAARLRELSDTIGIAAGKPVAGNGQPTSR